MASTYLSFTPSSAPTSSRIATISFWFKLSAIGTNFNFFSANQSGLTFPSSFKILLRDSNGRLELQQDDGSAGNHFSLRTNQLLRDASAWYHLVASYDTTQATASNRIKLYINGSQVTSFSQEDYPTQNLDLWLGDTDAHNVGRDVAYGSSYYDGSIAHFHYTDGTAYDASAFGETDATTGIWKPKTAPSVTYGTNGFFLKFENSGAFGTDSSGNGNNFTVNGTMTQTIDTPSNVFATANVLVNVPDTTSNTSNGNLTIENIDSGSGSSHKTMFGTIAISKGKWYWECKAKSGVSTKFTVGFSEAGNQSSFQQVLGTNSIVGNQSNTYVSGDAIGWYDTTLYKNGSIVASSLSQIVANDIMMIAVDCDNGKIYFGKNGTWRVANSSTFDPAQNDTTFTTGKFYVPAFSNEECGWFLNFGNGYFGTTAVSSAQNPDDGIGIFEYAVPSGYKALCTKSINAQEYD
jgi:hypothetical protein